jgi:hypothetical protein
LRGTIQEAKYREFASMGKAVQLENIVKQLQDWSEERSLIEEAYQCCRTSLENNERDDKEVGHTARWKLSDIQLHFDRQSLVFQHSVFSYPFVDTQIGLYVVAESKGWFRDLQPIGRYRLITSLDGQVEDDYLIFDDGYYLQ